jgi:hypothetical protein
MRNGIYRVWYKGRNVHGAAAVLFTDGQYVSCDRTHRLLGRYTDRYGRFAAEVFCKRHTHLPPSPEIPDLDEFHMIMEGASSDEIAEVRAIVPEKPGFEVHVEYVWMCEVR